MRYVLAVSALAVQVGCERGDLDESENGLVGVDPGDSGLEEVPGDTANDDSGADSGTDPVEEGTIRGVIDVALYTTDADGNATPVDWASAYGEEFPFGAIFVAAFQLDEETGATTFFDEYVIRNPTPTDNPYALNINPADADSVFVYAALDYWGDTVVSKSDPNSVYAGEIAISPGAETPDVDLVIDAPYYDFAGGGGGGGGDPGDWITVSGDALIAEEFTGGSCISLLYDAAGEGPYYSASFSPAATETGAEGRYSLVAPANWGQGTLMGAWDKNLNGLYEPADVWGGWVDETGSPANPLTLGATDLPDHTLMIPDGSVLEPGVVPFVRLAGDLKYDAGFETLPAGASVHVFVLKYRPQLEVGFDTALANAYDYQSYTGAELTGSSLAFSLLAPSDAIVYLWAYGDAEGDGIFNEGGAMIGAYGTNDGQLATGTSSQTGLEIVLTGGATP